jgi:hypothetical protein
MLVFGPLVCRYAPARPFPFAGPLNAIYIHYQKERKKMSGYEPSATAFYLVSFIHDSPMFAGSYRELGCGFYHYFNVSSQ